MGDGVGEGFVVAKDDGDGGLTWRMRGQERKGEQGGVVCEGG